jgi:hypothetical protein
MWVANLKVAAIYLIYPTAEKRAWDPMVTRISLTLRP